MRLREWIGSRPRGEKARIARGAKVRHATVSALEAATQLAKYATAVRVNAATRGAVSFAELMEPRRKRASKRPAAAP